MKIDLEKFLAATMLLATATTPACGSRTPRKSRPRPTPRPRPRRPLNPSRRRRRSPLRPPRPKAAPPRDPARARRRRQARRRQASTRAPRKRSRPGDASWGMSSQRHATIERLDL